MHNIASWLPTAITHMSQRVDRLFYIVLGICALLFVVVEVLLVLFIVRYRRTDKNRTGKAVHGNNLLELMWTVAPTVILVVIGVISLRSVYAEQNPPVTASANTIHVTGHMWQWEFKYSNGVDVSSWDDTFEVPAGQPVVFDITSADVIHGFYIPSVRIQQDALPGRQTRFWVNLDPTYIGKSFPVPCDQFCGLFHSKMRATMKVVSPAEYRQWLAQQLCRQQSSS
ncbi:cytochrome c oxidase subunit II [Alicyclobacillus sp. ALC3]|uniref:cytochrome c oxidase subunit II n=1 Tax=Alicyclobacillus sp. ALC3 TaxID=2796143 RepID=UPI0023782E1F|nr:cytochrome c oxidase subunit II [Alicyclobacillus sp. ALC3]WDL98272.1 cytochrome c oxidase subunit II [Alicyclobacillus sp. ALC3]